MDTRRWQRVAEIFDVVADAPTRERAALLQQLCADDAEVRHEVQALLAADANASGFERDVDTSRNVSAAAWAEDADAAAPTGARVGPWRLLRELGRGGMGVVWLAERADAQFQQCAALKLTKRGMDTDAVLARFLRERRILARLEHPHIAHLLDGGIDADGRPYFAMEFVDGEPLLDYCAQVKANLTQRLRLFMQVCNAVQFAHGQLVVHRDIKPSNILVTAAGDAKLLDFGIAKLLDDSDEGRTATVDESHRPLTPAYAAPEQLRGEAATAATDIHALGIVLCELLTGHRPLGTSDAPSREDTRRLHDSMDPAAPSRVADTSSPVSARRIRGDLDTIVLKALQHEPQRRYATAAALADDLQRFLSGQPISARRDNATYRMRKFIGRHRLGVAASTFAIVALVGALGLALWQAREKARQAQVSDQVTQFLIGLFSGVDPTHTSGATLTALDLLDQGTARLRADAGINASVRARLLHTVAITYTNLGLYDRALPLAQQALDLRRAMSDPLALAESELQLGRILRLKSDYAGAEPLLRDALRLRTSALVGDDPAVAEVENEVGLLLRAHGRFADADALLRAARDVAERHFGAGAIRTVRYLDDYASNLDDMGKRKDAEAIYRQALAIRQATLGPDDADVATSLLDLGVHLDMSGNYKAALPLLERAVAIRIKVFGPNHPLTGFARIGLASVYDDLNRFDEAENLARAALSTFRAKLPPEHPRISEALNMLALVAMQRRDFAGAVPLQQEVVARYRKTLGEFHPDTLAAKGNLAFALSRTGHYADAEALQREVIAHTGADNGQSVATIENLANTLMMQGKLAEAVEVERRAVAIVKQREGEESGNANVALEVLAGAEQRAGADADAERDFRSALAVGERLHASQNIDMYQWRLPLADFLVGKQRCVEASPLLDAVIEELESRQPSHDPLPWQQAQLLHAQCLIAAGHARQGEALQNSAREQLRKLPSVEQDLYPTARKLFTRNKPD